MKNKKLAIGILALVFVLGMCAANPLLRAGGVVEAKAMELIEPAPVIEETVPEEVVEPVVTLNIEPGLYENNFECSNGQKMEYRVRIPENPVAGMPVLVWLHDNNSCGKPTALTKSGMIEAAEDIGEERFIIIQPSCSEHWTSDKRYEMTMEIVDYIASEMRADTSRMVISGLGIGGNGALYYANKDSSKWMAVVPVSASTQVDMTNINTIVRGYYSSGDNWDVKTKMPMSVAKADGKLTYLEGVARKDMDNTPYNAEFFDWVDSL